MTKDEFIKKISELVVNENNKRGRPLYSSVVIGQACLETGYGQSTIMMKANAVFGIKATSNWKGKVYNARTREVYDNIITNITAYFRAYDNLQDSIKDYFDLICGLSRYKYALNCKTYYECINAIAQAGYATDPNYATLVKKIIVDNSLTKYDAENVKSQINYQIGKDYVLQDNMFVRRTAKVDKNNIKLYKELTADGKKHAKYKQDYAPAILEKGTVVTCKGTIQNNSDIWIKIPSGYVAGIYQDIIYVK